jgi:alpha-1,3-rhamnosyl/mannosyltransferase
LPRLIEAFAQLERDPAPVLVLPGYATSHEDELTRRIAELGISDRVRMLGWVNERELEGLYRSARCFVFPTLAEGFGLPVLEAMERGVPVACSNASSLPEVGGEAVRYFDPRDTADIGRAIGELLGDDRLAHDLAAAGLEQARKFSWEKTAQQTVASYRRASPSD